MMILHTVVFLFFTNSTGLEKLSRLALWSYLRRDEVSTLRSSSSLCLLIINIIACLLQPMMTATYAAAALEEVMWIYRIVNSLVRLFITTPLPLLLTSPLFQDTYIFELHNRSPSRTTCISMLIILTITTAVCVQVVPSTPANKSFSFIVLSHAYTLR